MGNYPIYGKRRYRFSSPYEFKEAFRMCPLTREFIDWVAENYKIIYWHDWKENTGAIWWSSRQINVSSCGSDYIVNLTLMHEIIHTAVPDCFHGFDGNFGEAIDQVAETYAKDLDFMEYVKKKIPFQGR